MPHQDPMRDSVGAAAGGSVILVDVRTPDDTPATPPGDPLPGMARTAELQVRLLDQNDRQAAANRVLLRGRGIRALNLVSSPGSGKSDPTTRIHPFTGGEMKSPCSPVNPSNQVQGFGL